MVEIIISDAIFILASFFGVCCNERIRRVPDLSYFYGKLLTLTHLKHYRHRDFDMQREEEDATNHDLHRYVHKSTKTGDFDSARTFGFEFGFGHGYKQ